MNVAKFHDAFQPEKATARIHIIGCGAVGSLLAETLVRMGFTNITLYDFDVVCSHNIANQLYVESDIGKRKLDALAERLLAINPDLNGNLKLKKEGYTNQNLNGYLFLCVDNIDLRRQIIEDNRLNPYIRFVTDFRMRLWDAQIFAADWSDAKAVTSLLNSMQFTHDEAKDETPVSACNLTLSVIPTVWNVVSLGVANFMNLIAYNKYKRIILNNPFESTVESY